MSQSTLGYFLIWWSNSLYYFPAKVIYSWTHLLMGKSVLFLRTDWCRKNVSILAKHILWYIFLLNNLVSHYNDISNTFGTLLQIITLQIFKDYNFYHTAPSDFLKILDSFYFRIIASIFIEKPCWDFTGIHKPWFQFVKNLHLYYVESQSKDTYLDPLWFHQYTVSFDFFSIQVLSWVHLLSHVQLFETPWTAACQASPSVNNSQSLLKLLSIELVHQVNETIKPSHPLLYISPPAFSIFQYRGLF